MFFIANKTKRILLTWYRIQSSTYFTANVLYYLMIPVKVLKIHKKNKEDYFLTPHR